MVLPYSSFAQKQLVKTVYKGTKGLFRTEAKVLTKEGVESANKSMLKDAFIDRLYQLFLCKRRIWQDH